MKKIILLFAIFLVFNIENQAQPYTPVTEVLSSGGESSISGNFSNFGVIGETIVDDEATANNLSNYCGFIYAAGFELRLTIDLYVFLEGAFSGNNMFTFLNFFNLIPLSQPYNTAPWNYSGLEYVSSIPNSNVVDWVLIELRDAPDPASATSSTTIAKQAAFILQDGSIVGLDGTSNLFFNETVTQNLFVVVWHRNHLGVMSANPLTRINGVYTYDFKTSATQAYNSGQKDLGGYYGMYSGDANADGHINNSDHIIWKQGAGKSGYMSTDFDMNGETDNIDKNDRWLENINKNSFVPE